MQSKINFLKEHELAAVHRRQLGILHTVVQKMTISTLT